MDFRGPVSGSMKLLAFFTMLIHHVGGHGRLMVKISRIFFGFSKIMKLKEPPARNAMWRFGFPNAVNYNDNGMKFHHDTQRRDFSIFNKLHSP